jgi:hypothetical protein
MLVVRYDAAWIVAVHHLLAVSIEIVIAGAIPAQRASGPSSTQDFIPECRYWGSYVREAHEGERDYPQVDKTF